MICRDQPAGAVMAESKGVTTRTPITQNLHSGVAALDILAPLGRGQCMMVLGEPGTGKSRLLLDAICSAAAQDIRCVYANVGVGASPSSTIGAAPILEPMPSPTRVAPLALCHAMRVR